MSGLTYAVVGTGAIGGYYGARLAQAGHDVHFLFHRDYEYVRQHGLKVNSYLGDFHLEKVNAYNDVALMPKADVVIVGLKTVRESLVAELVAPLLKNDTLVVLIQNGVGVEEFVQEQLPGAQLVAGLAFICSGKTSPGVVDHQFYGSINLAPFSVRDHDRFALVLGDFVAAGVEAHEVAHATARWRKAMWNMPFNGLSVVMRCQTDDLVNSPEAEQLARDLMAEIIAASRALGVEGVDEAFADKMIQMTKDMVPYSPSMRLDFDFGRPMEIEFLYSRPVALARLAGCPMPKMEMLELQLKMIQAKQLK